MTDSQKAREVFVCQCVAEAMNIRLGTDYRAEPCNSEPPDVLFVSQSGKWPTREAEVVSTPQDFTIRSDNKNLAKLDHELRQELNRRGISGHSVHVGWSADAIRHGIKDWRCAIGTLAGLIIECINRTCVAKGPLRVSKSALSHSDVYRSVDDVAIFAVPQPYLQVQSGKGLLLPSDGRWVEEAIRHKSSMYPVRLRSKWMLVIDGFPDVDDEQVDAYLAAVPGMQLPFAEIWILTVSGLHQLKSNENNPLSPQEFIQKC